MVRRHTRGAPVPDERLRVESVNDWFTCTLCVRDPNTWELDIPRADPEQEGTWEVLLAVGNGYFATRGAAPERVADGTHYPGTYVAGVYNRLTSLVEGQPREDESIVNIPNWLPVTVHGRDGDLLDPMVARISHDHRLLDLRRGMLHRELHVENATGERTLIRQQRFASMQHPHLAYMRTTVVPVNWSGLLNVISWTDGTVKNDNVATSRTLAKQHLAIREAGHAEDGSCVLVAETVQSQLRIAIVTRTHVAGSSTPTYFTRSGKVGGSWATGVVQGLPLLIDKSVAIYTSRDHAISEPLIAAQRALDSAPEFSDAQRAHADEWRHIWNQMRLEVQGRKSSDVPGLDIQRALNVHLFHVMQTLSRHTSDIDVGVPARGLHGEAYHGRVFWDELFVFPFLNLRMPELTRSLLMYRYRRLPEARRLADRVGADGALFPWQSGSDGREETPNHLYNPRSGSWMPDHSLLQFHVGLAVAHNVWHYFQVTGDVEFLAAYGAELLVEIARFWSARAEYDGASCRYHLRGMMGPDEFHDGYPESPGRGIDDNAYVALMTSWLFSTTLHVREILGGHHTDDLWQRLAVDPDELERWDALSRQLYVPFMPNGLLAQFEGYERLQELDFGAYVSRYGDIGRLDLILAAEGDSTNRYKVSKQADVLMLFYLFSAEELQAIFSRLRYQFDPTSIPPTVEYYLQRTTHGSTLSRVVHSWVLSRGDRRASWHLLCDALRADIDDMQGGTTREGIHLAAMAATADLLQRCFSGLQIRADALHLHPQLPAALDCLTFDMRYRGHRLTIKIAHRWVRLTSHPGMAEPITVVVDSRSRRLSSGGSAKFVLRHRGGPARTSREGKG